MPQHEGNITHEWEVAANVPIPERAIKRALLRRSYRVPTATAIDVLEIVCVKCRRPYDDVHEEPCVDAESTEHLRGGPIGTRKRRKPLPALADYRGAGMGAPRVYVAVDSLPDVHPWDEQTGS